MDNHYDYIRKVADLGSISKAADELFITPSALSKFIQRTEEEYGAVLFDRVGKRFELTYAGERYLDWQRRLNIMRHEMLTEIHDISHSYSGRLRIGVQLEGASILIEKIIPRFHQEFPNILLEIHEDVSVQIQRQVEHNALDLGMIPFRYDQNDSLNIIRLVENQLALVVPKGHPLTHNAVIKEGFRYPWIDIREADGLPYIAPFPGQDAYLSLENVQHYLGVHFNIAAHARLGTTVLTCIKNGMGITITSDQIVRSHPLVEAFDLLSFGEVKVVSHQAIIYNKDHYLSHAAERFIEMLREDAAELDERQWNSSVIR